MSDLDARMVRIVRVALETEPSLRDSFIVEQCGEDQVLRQAVERLLRSAAEIERDTGADDDPAPSSGDDPPDPLLGVRLGPFRTLERIGQGGMGVVYRAEREEGGFEQTVAIKLIRRGFDFDEVHKRFLRERRILARLNHPNLARLIDGGVTDDGRPWFALEYVHGESILTWCDHRRLDVRGRVRLFIDVCAAVQYAHAQLVVHRDLKPGNVMVDDRGTVRLLDFGISRLLDDEHETGTMVTLAGLRPAFTPEYAAPEQLAGEPVGVAADVYALGVILFELVAGVLPHAIDRRDLMAARQRIQTQPVPSLGVAITRASGPDHEPVGASPADRRLACRGQTMYAYQATVRGDLSRILDKALAVEVGHRYATVEAFAGDLGRWLAGIPVKVSGHGWMYRFGKFARRNAMAVSVVAALLAGLLVSLGWALERAHSERQQREIAQAALRRSDSVRDYIALMFRSASEQVGDGQIDVRDILARSSERVFTQFKDDPAAGRSTALMVAELYLAMGDLDGAWPLLERLVSASDAEDADDVGAKANYLLAQLEYRRGRPGDALDRLDAAQSLWRAQPDRNALMIHDSEGVRAQVLRGMGRLPEALAIQQSVIDERLRRSPEPDEGLAEAYNNLAITLMAAFRFDEAEQMSDRAVAIQSGLGIEHGGNTIAFLGTRASIMTAQRRHGEAESTYRSLIALKRQLHGESSLDLAILLGSLGTSILFQERLDEAATVLEDSIAMAVRHGGADSAAVLTLRLTLAGTYSRLVRGEDAFAQLARVQEYLDAHDDNPSLRAMLSAGRARAHLSMGRLDRARAALADAEATYAAMGVSGAQFQSWLEPLRMDIAKAEALRH